MENKYELKIDLQSGESIMTKAKYRTGDTKSAKMEVTLTNEGLVQSILGEDITWNFEKADHTHCTQNMTNGVSITDAENGVLLIVFENQTLACPGLVRASITFVKDGVINNTITFAFTVNGTVNGGDLSINYITDIETKIAGWQTEFDDIKDAYTADLALSAENANLEMIGARKGETDLGTKIGKMDVSIANNVADLANIPTQTYITEKVKTVDMNTQLALKANQSSLTTTNANVAGNTSAITTNTNAIQALASGAPKSGYATISALTTAFPSGNTSPYLTDDGQWNTWNGTVWIARGVYQGTSNADSSIAFSKLIAPEGYIYNDNGFTLNTQAMTLSNTTTVLVCTTTGLVTVPIISIDLTAFNLTTSTIAGYCDLLDSNKLKVCQIGNLPLTKIIVLFYYYGGMTNLKGVTNLLTKSLKGIKLIYADGTVASNVNTADLAVASTTVIKPPNQVGYIYNDNAIVFDLVAKKITFNISLLLYGATYKASPVTADFDLTTIDYIYHTIVCYFDGVSQTIKVCTINLKPLTDSYVLFTYYGNGTNLPTAYSLITESSRSVHIKNLDGTMRSEVQTCDTATNVINSAEPAYDETKNRLLLPPKMFFVDTQPLPLYKSNIIADNSKNLNILKTALINIDVNNVPKIQYFNEDITLDGTLLQNIFTIGVKQYTIDDYNYYGDIAKSLVTVASKAGKTPKIINIGDSLTNRNIPQRLKDKLTAYGVTATMQGTMPNYGDVVGEGREGWEFENFIGKDNTFSGDASAIVRQTTAGTSTLSLNPFLKLANATDISNHPNWCFRNTGASLELSYTQDTDKTGNFYIFDFTYYLTTQGFTIPDVVTLALSTNDILHDNVISLADSKLGLEIMIKQIKSACPSCKIGVVPAPNWGSNVMGNLEWNTYVAPWLENCMTDVITYQATITGLDIVPVWCHLNRDFNFPYDTSVALSSVNQTKKAHRAEFVHFGESGKVEYINALSSYIMNVI